MSGAEALAGLPWRSVAPILQIVCPLGAIQSIIYLGSSIYLSQGMTRRAFAVTCVNTPVLGLAFYFGLKANGLAGMLWAYFAVSVVSAPFLYLAAASLVGLRLIDMVRNLAGVAASVLVMVLALLALQPMADRLGPLVQMGLLIPLGAVVYVATLHFFKVSAYQEALRLIQAKLRPGRAAGPAPQSPQVR